MARFTIIYDYSDGAGNECNGIREDFDGTYSEALAYIKEMRSGAYSNIDLFDNENP